jgi:hypothetical protein
MKPLRRAWAVMGGVSCAALAAAILHGCGGSQPQQQSPGVTNAQPAPEIAPNVAPVREGQCLSRGDACSFNMDCCSQWCVNDHCSIPQP